MAIVGLTSLFQVPPASLPPSVRSEIARINKAVIFMQHSMWEQKDEDARFRAAEEAGEADFDDDADLAFAEDFEGVDDHLDVNALDGNVVNLELDDDDFADADGIFRGMEMEEEEELSHTLDKLDEVQFWCETVQQLSNSTPEFAALMNTL